MAADNEPGAGGDLHQMPVMFLSHGGGPCFFMKHQPGSMFDGVDEESETTRRMRALRKEVLEGVGAMQETPRAIVLISAHWEEPVPTVVTSQTPGLLYDYYGFPEDTYGPHLTYPARGEPELAGRVVELLRAAGLSPQTTTDRGLDHGVFIPLKLIFPDAEVPIVQVSLVADLDPSAHIRLGRALAPLRSQSVLIVGSGQLTHNMRAGGQGPPPAWASNFVQWVDDTLVTGKDAPAAIRPEDACEADACGLPSERLCRWESAPGARTAHPREEHLMPLLVAAAAAEGLGSATKLFHNVWMASSFSLGGYLWSAAEPEP